MTDSTQQQRLEAEFPSQMLGSVTKGGTKLTYVPVSEVIQRLNDVLGMTAWSWEATRVWRDEVSPEWVLAVGKMTATIDGVTATKSGEGGVKVKQMKDGGLVDLGDEFKGAASDALKKAAQKFGVALYLSRKPDARRYEEPAPTRDAIREGWTGDAEQTEAADGLAASIKAAGPDMAQAMREYRSRLGVLWPPTKDEHDELSAELQRLIQRAPQLAPEAPTAPVQPSEGVDAPIPAPEPAPEPVSAPTGELDRDAERAHAAAEYVKTLDAAQLLMELGARNTLAPRTKAEQRSTLADILFLDASWVAPGQEALL